jgi:hypothetical protein
MAGLDLFSVCKKGYLRPTGESAISGDNTEPFRETDSMRKLECDNPDCETNRTNIGVTEKEINVDDAVTVKVIRAEDVEKRKNNPKLCTSCNKETEIVFAKGDARFCKECLDNFRDQPTV